MSIKSLGKQSLIYGVGHILVRLVTFLLLPLYTNTFTAQEYGTVALFYTFLSFMNVIMRYGMGASFLKYFVPADGNERKTVLTSVIVSLFITGIPFFFLWHGNREFLSPIILGVNRPEFITMMGIIIVLDTIWSIPMLGFRSENRPFLFILFSLLNVSITIGLNLYFILMKHMGIEAIFLSNVIASIVLFLLSIPFIFSRLNISSLSFEKWKKIVQFAIPFLPAGLFSMAMEVADRYILKALTDLSTVGIYNAGYKIGMLMMLAVMGFNMGWQPYFIKEGKEGNQGELFGRITTFVISGLGFIWLMLFLWSDELIQANIMGYSFFGSEFQESLRIVPLIGLGYLFYGFYILQTPGIFLKDKPSYAAWTRFIGAISNIGLCFLLIPNYGAIGAAISTSLSFFIMSICMYYINQKLYPIKIEWTKIGTLCLFLIGSVIVSIQSQDHYIVNIILTILYLSSLFGMKWIDLKKLKSIFK
ncbi:MAG: polysaccharide biosynthesis C-terminal domain-containing protein [Candidatus Marinimicrobia bacterium]|nr:polysaccharide biosynthesis C-terminal domain-containing protein [Candidatus Neomarinimicrobiota bacterium]